MTNERPIKLSVIIPAYNEQRRIADSLFTIKDYLQSQPYRSEIITVNDGSANLTLEVFKLIDIYRAVIKEQERSVLLDNAKYFSKGYSKARGMQMAHGDIIFFTDADLSTPIEELEKLLLIFNDGYDLVIGSRNLPEYDVKHKPLHLNLMSVFFNFCVSLIAIRGISNTQCGFKTYTCEAARQISLQQRIYHFGFNIEHLYLAQQMGFRIKEVPVR